MGEDARRLIADLAPLPISDVERKAAIELSLARHHKLDMAETVNGYVRRWAESAPDRIAVIDKTGTVTYRELTRRVATVQAFLEDQGCRAGDVVAVTGTRSVDSIATVLALESLGAVYLPIDAAWPESRVATILRQSDASHLLSYHRRDQTSELLVETAKAAATVGIPLLTLPECDSAAINEFDVNAATRWRCADDGEPRYVYYTSGTTGLPKGALIEHRGMINHLWAKVLDTDMTDGDVLAFTAPLTFDIATWQMLAPLLLGGSVAVLDDADMSFPRKMVKRLRQAKVTVLELVPTMLGLLIDQVGRLGGLPRLRCILSTGEELHPTLAARLADTMPGVTVLNVYGFTETADDVTHHVVRPADLTSTRLPVGSPVINVSLYVLLEEGRSWRAARQGEQGELFVGGLPPGCGYLSDERSTKAAFFRDVLDPASPTGRLYKTGDAAIVTEGVLWCLGRLDRQVKVSGVRMELGEIEARVKSHPAMIDCAVVVQGGDDRRELVAFYVSSDGSVRPEDLREFLGQALPAAMVPRRWHATNGLPVNANGKTDHKALALMQPDATN